MSEEYIKKQDAINAVVNAERIGLAFGYSRAIDSVRAIPPDDVAPVVHANGYIIRIGKLTASVLMNAQNARWVLT